MFNIMINQLEHEIMELKAQLVEMERQRDNFRDQVKISDEAFNFHLKRANDEMERCNKLEVQLAQAQCKLAQLQQVAAQTGVAYGFDDTGWLSPDEAKALVDKLEQSDWDKRNTRDALLDEAAKLQAQLKAWEKP